MNAMNNKITSEVTAHRKSDYEIDPLFLNRWSPRSFLNKEIPNELLFSLFEAARWAPSGNNIQPWRFIIARAEQEKVKFYEFINEGNRKWCEKAPVLALILSNKETPNGNFNRSHAFDAGTSWGYLALQSIQKGLIVHAMGGFDRDKARDLLHVPEEYELHAVVAIGYRGDIEVLPDDLREREKPSTRRTLKESIYEGEYGKEADLTSKSNRATNIGGSQRSM